MLQWIRDKSQGVIAFIIVAVLCLAFGLWGIHNYLRSSHQQTAVAKVNGHKITQQQLAQAFARFRSQNISQHPKWFSSQKAVNHSRQRVLHNIVERYLLVHTAQQYGLRASNDLLKQELAMIPAFQKNGVFSKQRFQRFLMASQMSQAGFLQMMRKRIVMNQMHMGILSSSFILPQELTQAQRLFKQKRSLYYVIIPHQQFMASKSVPEALMHYYYKQHLQQFKIPKQVQLAYVKLTKKQLRQQIQPSQKQLKQYYNKHLEQFAKPEQWQVEYLQLPESVSDSKAHSIYQQWQQGQHDAKQLAQEEGVSYHRHKTIKADDKQNSPWQKAVTGHTHEGTVLEPFKTNKAHIIARIKHHQQETAPSFDKIKNKVKQAYLKAQANKQFSHKVNQLANLTFEHASSLQPAANKLGLQIRTTDFISQQSSKPYKGILHHKKVRQAAFSDEVVNNKHNSDIINLSNDAVVIVRAHKVKSAHPKPYKQVKSTIRHKLAKQRAAYQAKQHAQHWQQQIDSEHSLKAIAHQHHLKLKTLNSVGRHAGSGQASAIVQKGFHLLVPADNHTSSAVQSLSSGDAAVIQLFDVHKPSVKAEDVPQAHRQALRRYYGHVEYMLYQQAVKDKGSVQYYQS